MTLGVYGIGQTGADVGVVDRPVRSVPGPSEGSFQAALGRAGAGQGAASQQVAPTRTPISGRQAAEALRSAYAQVTGEQPSQGTLAILTSHWALETGQGKSMYNFNFAGIKGKGPEGMTAVMNTREGYGANAVRIRDGFRAYSSAEAGARDYVSLLQRRYGAALDAARAEQPAQFAKELKAAGYYTGDPALYAKGVTQLANRAMEYGFDALGTAAGELAGRPSPLQPYFSGDPSAFSAGAPYGSASGNNWFDGLGLSMMDGVFEPNTASVDAVSDEMSRTALLIAARRGAV